MKDEEFFEKLKRKFPSFDFPASDNWDYHVVTVPRNLQLKPGERKTIIQKVGTPGWAWCGYCAFNNPRGGFEFDAYTPHGRVPMMSYTVEEMYFLGLDEPTAQGFYVAKWSPDSNPPVFTIALSADFPGIPFRDVSVRIFNAADTPIVVYAGVIVIVKCLGEAAEK